MAAARTLQDWAGTPSVPRRTAAPDRYGKELHCLTGAIGGLNCAAALPTPACGEAASAHPLPSAT